jgi:hypothetical protein
VTRREAEPTLLLALADIETGTIRDHTPETVGSYAQRWPERRAPFIGGTLAAYRDDIVCRIVPTLGYMRLRDVTAESIEQESSRCRR